ncbi:hypothetical protein [Bacillus pinisoli]|uniref:hypothetical protein n=1 Tax=Bacillus pinisoli TaxID=2901866 RepID=UPI001FF45A0E|nr:hypothetical protein [Bacillus pinisoli]
MVMYISILIILILLVVWRIWSKSIWQTVLVVSDYHSEDEVREKYNQLVKKRVRCKLKTEMQSPGIARVDEMGAGQPQPKWRVLKLLVHKNDVNQISK